MTIAVILQFSHKDHSQADNRQSASRHRSNVRVGSLQFEPVLSYQQHPLTLIGINQKSKYYDRHDIKHGPKNMIAKMLKPTCSLLFIQLFFPA